MFHIAVIHSTNNIINKIDIIYSVYKDNLYKLKHLQRILPFPTNIISNYKSIEKFANANKLNILSDIDDDFECVVDDNTFHKKVGPYMKDMNLTAEERRTIYRNFDNFISDEYYF